MIGLIAIIAIVVIAVGVYVVTIPPSAPKPTTTSPTTQTTTPTTTTTPTPEKLKVAAIIPAPMTTEVWNICLNNALEAAVKKYGIVYSFTEKVAFPDGERIARTYIDQGYKLILLHSGYTDAVKAIAKAFPNVIVFGAGGGTELAALYPPPATVPPNVGHYDTYMHESSYLAGLLAGKMTKTNKIGISVKFPVANANRFTNGFIAGVKKANENAQIKITWLLSWADPPKSKEQTLALIEWGADFVYAVTVPGAELATEETGKAYLINLYVNLTNLAPKSMMATATWNLESVIDDIVNGVTKGKFESKEYGYGMSKGGTDLIINFPDKVPADVLELIRVTKQGIIDGKIVIPDITLNPEQYWGAALLK